MRELVSILILVLCGCGDDAATPTDAGTDPDTGTTDTDAGTTDTDAGPAPSADAGFVPPGEGFMRNRVALDRILAANCACNFMERGFGTAAECEAFGVLAEERTCEDMAYAASMAESATAFDCTTLALERGAGCIEAAACDTTTVDACIEEVNMANAMCPEVPAAYVDALAPCYDAMVVGTTPSTCPENMMASSATGNAVFMGSTVLGGDDIRSTCGGGSAPDRAFQWTAPAAGLYDIDTLGSNFDTMLHVFTGCPPASLIVCDDDITDGINQRSQAQFMVADAQTVVIVIDGFGAEAGDFQINITPAP